MVFLFRLLSLLPLSLLHALGDTVECLHPAGNHVQRIGRMENAAGEAVAIAPGSGHRVWIDLPALYTKSFVARFF